MAALRGKQRRLAGIPARPAGALRPQTRKPVLGPAGLSTSRRPAVSGPGWWKPRPRPPEGLRCPREEFPGYPSGHWGIARPSRWGFSAPVFYRGVGEFIHSSTHPSIPPPPAQETAAQGGAARWRGAGRPRVGEGRRGRGTADAPRVPAPLQPRAWGRRRPAWLTGK